MDKLYHIHEHTRHTCLRDIRDFSFLEGRPCRRTQRAATGHCAGLSVRCDHCNETWTRERQVQQWVFVSLVVSLRISSMCIRAYWQSRVDVNRGQTTREADGRRGEQRTLKVSKSVNVSFGTGPQLSSERRWFDSFGRRWLDSRSMIFWCQKGCRS